MENNLPRRRFQRGFPFVLFLAAMASCAAFPPRFTDHGSTWAAEPNWARAAEAKPPMTAPEARAFMKRLADYVVANHLKTDERSPQRGLIYEYFWVAKKGTPQQWLQGEALDTMHDGAWFACAMVNAYRATGDPFYKEVLTKWQLPFYLKMLNQGDELFTSERNDAHPDKRNQWRNSPEWLLQGREKGFAPYWWDDGAAVSLERSLSKQPLAYYPARDDLAGRPNPDYRLSGYSLGSSNHEAQDLACMLQLAWLLLREGDGADDKRLAAEVAAAARNLQDCRARHGSAAIPAVLAADGLANQDEARLARIPEETWISVLEAKNHYRSALAMKAGQKSSTPGFADDQQYHYYSGLARSGTLAEPLAFRVVCDPYVEAKMFDAYYDDAPRPAGVNRFDLYPFNYVDGRPEHLRSQRKGPNQGPVPIGSRMGPQNMICCGWALQALRAYPELWRKGLEEAAGRKIPIASLGLTGADGSPLTSEQITRWHQRELGGGLRTWEAIWDEYGYIPTGIGCQGVVGDTRFDAFSDTGGYAHLISAAAQWILYLERKNDWEIHQLPRIPPLEK